MFQLLLQRFLQPKSSVISRRLVSTTTAASGAVLLRHDTQHGVAYLTLNRPNQYNALNQALLTALQENLNDIAAQQDTIRAVVIAAKGKAFCSGHDLKEMRKLQQDNDPEAHYKALFDQCSQMMMTIHKLPQPVIAQVQGLATAAGCQLVATCDLAVATHSARFATSGINVGLFCSTPAVALSRNLTRKQAFEMLFTGDFINAQTALERGLVNQVVPSDQLEEAVQVLTAKLVAKSPVAVRMGKKMFYQQLEMTMEQAYDHGSQIMACNMMTDDAMDGIDAFIEKRPLPDWKGK